MRAIRLALAIVWVLASAGAWCAPGIAWKGCRPVPQPVQWASAVPVGGKACLIGGAVEDELGLLKPNGAVQIYDPDSDSWTQGTPMPEPRCLASAVAVGGKVYVMGGTVDPKGAPSDRNDVYDFGAKSWSSAKSLPVPLAGHAAAAFGGKIYVMGGSSGAFQNSVYIYDPASDSWGTGAAMPQTLAYGALAASGNKLVWMGGALKPPTAPSDCFGYALVYDPAANSWASATPALEAPVLAYGQAAVDTASGKVYVAGGETFDATAGHAVCSSTVQVYDPSSGTVSRLANMPGPQARGRAAALYLGDRVFVFAGLGDMAAGETFSLVDSYDPAHDVWDRALPDLPAGGGGTAGFAAIIGRTILNVRGAAVSTPDGKVDVYDLDSRAWKTQVATVPTPVFYFAGGEWNGKIVISGGITSQFAIPGKTYLYDPTADTWSAMSSDPLKHFCSAGVVLDGKFYVFGGDTSTHTTIVVPDLHVLDLTSGTWSAKKSMPFGMEGFVALPCGGKIYLVGGTKGDVLTKGNINAQILVYDPATDSYDLTKAPMPRPVAFPAGAVWDRYLIIHGGHFWRDGGGKPRLDISNAAEIYDTQADTWTMADGLFGRTDDRAVAVDGNLYVLSGTGPDGTACDRLVEGRIEGAGPSDLSAASSSDRTSGPAPLEVHFTGSATGGTPPYSFEWRFDQDGQSSEQNPSWTFDSEGSHAAALTVTDSAGNAADAPPIAITATAPASPPVISAMSKQGGPFRINVGGSNLQSGVKVFIGSDATPWAGVTWNSATKLTITGGSSLKAKAPKGQQTPFRFVNPDGGEAVFTFHW